MQGSIFSYALLVALATGLLVAAITDLQRRQIDNGLTAAIALGAPLFWVSAGLGLSEISIHFLIALATFVVLLALFSFGMMGGGDVKLLVALSLWIEPFWYLRLLIVMALAGGVLTLIFASIHFARRREGKVAVPYGVAISGAGLWVLANVYIFPLNSAGNLG